jgi:hypothetical protein
MTDIFMGLLKLTDEHKSVGWATAAKIILAGAGAAPREARYRYSAPHSSLGAISESYANCWNFSPRSWQ